MKTKKKHSIFFKTQIYLITFCVATLLLLWLFETFYFKVYYRIYQQKTVNNMANLIQKKDFNENETNDYIENLAYKNNACIVIYNDYGEIIEYNTKMPGCNLNNYFVRTAIFDFLNNDEVKFNTVIKNKNNEYEGYLYAISNDDIDIFIYASLKDNNLITNLLHGQFIYIILISIVLSSALALYISSLITKPMRSINRMAKNIGKENYNNIYEETGIKEIDEISQTLDNVQKELGKVSEYQKDLLANVTHDLKTPLTMIKAYAEKIKDISYKDKEKLDKDVKVIIDESDRLTNLVNDILDMSKASSNMPLEYEEYDLIKEINTIMDRFNIIKETENYNFVFDMPKEALVYADKKRINQVIYNLISNAINYTGDDKKVTIKVTPNNKGFLVEIIDTGKGIEQKDIDNIWTKYYKNDKNHKRNVISSGIGLSIVKEVLEKHKFEYGVKSTIKKGSTFYFNICSSKVHKNNTKKS